MSKAVQRIGWGVMTLSSVAIVAVAALPYSRLDPAFVQASPVFSGRFGGSLGAFWLYIHIFGAALALLLGPFQFIKGLRDRYPVLHRWIGRVYLVGGILLGGLGGLVVAQGTVAGLTGRVGFSLLALLWWLTGWQAYASIRQGRTQAHQDWMIRNFALTFAAVTLRLYIGLGMGLLSGAVGTLYPDSGALFLDVYRTVPWLCWVPNLLVAEAIVAKRRGRREKARRPQPAGPALATD